jgi:hypothetical protein
MGNPDQPRDSKGRWTKSTTTAGAAAIVVVGLSIVGGGVGGGGAASVSVESTVGQSVRANVTKSKEPAKKGKRDDAWLRMGLKRLNEVRKQASTCAANSYGDVRQFFVRTPCRSLDRMLFALGDGRGGSVVVSVAWVGMSTTANAERLKTLADKDGTGNVSPLASALVGAAGIKFTGRHYDSRQAGKLVVISEAEPLSGAPDPDFLKGLAEVAKEFPPP